MKIEYFKYRETDNYILHIPHIEMTDDEGKKSIFIDTDAFISLMNFVPEWAYQKDDFAYNKASDIQYDLEYRELIIGALAIIDYEVGSIPHGSTLEKDKIWYLLSQLGIVFEKFNPK